MARAPASPPRGWSEPTHQQLWADALAESDGGPGRREAVLALRAAFSAKELELLELQRDHAALSERFSEAHAIWEEAMGVKDGTVAQLVAAVVAREEALGRAHAAVQQLQEVAAAVGELQARAAEVEAAAERRGAAAREERAGAERARAEAAAARDAHAAEVASLRRALGSAEGRAAAAERALAGERRRAEEAEDALANQLATHAQLGSLLQRAAAHSGAQRHAR